MSARYIVRLDDACPTMAHHKWLEVENIFDQFCIKPIVAVIPDNQDNDVVAAEHDEHFWMRALAWQTKGWTIAQHGYQHILQKTNARQYLPFHASSEFAGLSYDEQAAKIKAGWETLRSRGLEPTVWIAPAHSFDRLTLLALEAETTIRVVSDGIARDQFHRDGFHWLPQQLWSFVPKPAGIWTVCLHPNTMSLVEISDLKQTLLNGYAEKVISVADVCFTGRAPSFSDRVEAARFWHRHYIQRAINKVKTFGGI